MRWLGKLVDVRDAETRPMSMSFLYFFFVMSGYFILRPIRDEVAAASGVSRLPWLFTGTLAVTLCFNPLFSALVVRFRARRVIATSYHFFAANLIGFYLLLRLSPSNDAALAVWTGRAFYVWTSAFNLFVVSIFWSFMADVFRSEQAKRLFGFIGVGGTLGSIVGSGVTASLASRIGSVNLLLVSAVLIELAVFTVIAFPQMSSGRAATRGDAPIGGRVWAGITDILRSPYLLVICGFLILYVIGSTFLYFEQADIVGRTYLTRDARTTVLAQIELVAQGLTVLTQVFFTGRIIRWIGLTATLALLPVVSMLGFASLGAIPVFMTLAVFIVVRRAANFSLTNPAMEVLFTVVPREEKYKAKNFIETFVYRGGDQIAAWVYAGLAALGLGMAGISFAAVPLAGVWFGAAVWLGRRQAHLAASAPDPHIAAATPVSVPSPA